MALKRRANNAAAEDANAPAPDGPDAPSAERTPGSDAAPRPRRIFRRGRASEVAQTDSPEPSPGAERPARRRRPALVAALALVLLGGAGAGLWYGLPVRVIEVEGNRFVSDARVAQLAGLRPDLGWLFYEEWTARGLAAHPWIRETRITKHWPDRVVVRVTERVPSVRLRRGGREVVTDWDGTVLPGAPKVGPVVSGWGPDRTVEAVQAARLLARFEVRSVEYSPRGLTVNTERGTIWSGSLVSLRKYAASVTMFEAKRISIYPWGVSVQE